MPKKMKSQKLQPLKPFDPSDFKNISGLLPERQEVALFDYLKRCKTAITLAQNEQERRFIVNNANKAKEVLIAHNQIIVRKAVTKYAPSACGLTFDELTSAGNKGLLKAIERYQHRHAGSLFSAYAQKPVCWSIVDEIRHRFCESRKHVSLEHTFDQIRDEEIRGDEEAANHDPAKPSLADQYAEIAEEIAVDKRKTPEDLIIDVNRLSFIRQAISKLSLAQQKVVEATLAFFSGDLPNDDAMFEATGFKKDNFYYHRRNAFAKLRVKLVDLAA